jgi:hypothetical protein
LTIAVERPGQSVVSPRPPAIQPGALVSRLRGDGAERPLVDPGFAGGLRDWLEDSVAQMVPDAPGESWPVRIGKQDVHDALACEGHAMPRRDSRIVSFELARGVLVDALFRQWVTVGVIEDPWRDALDAAGLSDPAVCRFVESMGVVARRRLEHEVAEHTTTICSSWPVMNESWLARTQERMEVHLAGGAIVLSGSVDLGLGAPSAGRSSVCLVELKSGARRIEHRADLHFYGLLETMRSGAPPFRVATYYSSTGELDVEQVSEDLLVASLQRLLVAARRVCRLAAGADLSGSADSHCASRSEMSPCGAAQARVVS